MIKKIPFIFILLIILSNCGYNPIYSSKKINFNIIEITNYGDKIVGKTIERKISRFTQNDSVDKNYNINLYSNINKNTTSKDKKGNPSTFDIKLSVKVIVINSSNEKREKIFNEGTSYKNNDNKFELKQYEESLVKNFSNKIADDIIQYLQTVSSL